MFLILVFLLFSCLHGFERIPRVHIADDPSYTPEYLKLTRVLNADLVRNEGLGSYFSSKIFRYNLTQSEHAETCFSAYTGIKMSPFEDELLDYEIPMISRFAKELNTTYLASWDWTKLYRHGKYATYSHTIIQSRRDMISKLLANVSPEARKFMDYVVESIMKIILSSFTKTEAKMREKMNDVIIQIGQKYKGLSAEVKVDLERALCVRSTLRWLNYDMGRALDDHFALFADAVGLNIDDLLVDNKYLSNFTEKEVKEKFAKIAEKLELPAQEFVDNCAKMYSVMKLTEVELALLKNGTSDYFMGKQWGKKVYHCDHHKDTDEFMNVLSNEGAPFYTMFHKRWNYLQVRSMNERFQYDVRQLENALIDEVRLANNYHANIENEDKPEIDVEEFIKHVRYYRSEEIEQAFCLKATMESILERDL